MEIGGGNLFNGGSYGASREGSTNLASLNTSIRAGTETRPTNLTMKIWRRMT